MKKIIVQDILKVTNGKLIAGNVDLECEDVSTDTRKIKQGDTYIGIKGANFNGNEFWEKAFQEGATIAIVQGVEFKSEQINKYQDKAIILVEDTIKALGQLAAYKRSLYDIPVVAITGSVGKTSTKDIVANVVSQKYKTLKTEGNFNNHIGLPLTLLKLKDHEAAVVEMGMNHEGEIRYLTNIAKPTISVITNIGTSHIGNLGSRENILKAKLEILEGMEKKKIIFNNDNDLLHDFCSKNLDDGTEIITFGIENESDNMATEIQLKENRSTFNYRIQSKNINEKITVPIGGIHFVYNSLCAAAVGEALNIDISKIKQGIEGFELTQKRMEITSLSNGAKLINDSYNASLESMKASLKYLSEFKEYRKIAVLGDMLELGDFSKELHKQVGKEVAKNKVDILICMGEESKYIIEGAETENDNIQEIKHFDSREEVTEYLKNIIKHGDMILFKASNGMRFYDIVEEVKKYFQYV